MTVSIINYLLHTYRSNFVEFVEGIYREVVPCLASITAEPLLELNETVESLMHGCGGVVDCIMLVGLCVSPLCMHLV